MSGATLLPQDEAAAVLGLPLGGQAVADVHDLSAPCVGRLPGRPAPTTAVNPVWPVEGVGLVVTSTGSSIPLGASAARPQRCRRDRRVGGGVRALGAAVVAGPDQTGLLSIHRRISVAAEVATAGGGARGRGVLADIVRRVLARLVDARSAA